MLAATLLTAVTVSTGCTLLDSLDGLTGGAEVSADAQPPVDGTSPADGETSDAGIGSADAWAPDASLADGARTGPTSDAGAAHDASAEASGPTAYWQFSDGFESGDFRYWPLAKAEQSATLSVVDAGAHTGCCAMHATDGTADSAPLAYVAQTWTTAGVTDLSSGTIAMRLWFRTTTAMSYLGVANLDISQWGSATGGIAAAQTANVGSGYSWSVYIEDTGTPKGFFEQTNALSTVYDGNWHCAEFVVNVSADASVGAVSTFYDGQNIQLTGKTATDQDGGWGWALMGVRGAQANTAFDVYFDDFVVALYGDTSPSVHIGCGP